MTEQLYSATSLETAACLWEAVLTMESSRPKRAVSSLIRHARECLGSSHLRLTVIGWTDAADEAWSKVNIDPLTGRDGEYGEAFDWDFIPEWIDLNVDWSSYSPVIKPLTIQPYTGDFMETWKQWALDPAITPEFIEQMLPGIERLQPSDDGKVALRWEWTYNGQDCAVWDYQGRRWSAFGPREVFDRLYLKPVGEQQG